MKTMPNDDLISRPELIQRIDKCVEVNYVDSDPLMAIRDIKALISVLPAVDAVPVVHAHWIYGKRTLATCSNCHRSYYDAYDLDNNDRYCRGCGAIMDEE